MGVPQLIQSICQFCWIVSWFLQDLLHNVRSQTSENKVVSNTENSFQFGISLSEQVRKWKESSLICRFEGFFSGTSVSDCVSLKMTADIWAQNHEPFWCLQTSTASRWLINTSTYKNICHTSVGRMFKILRSGPWWVLRMRLDDRYVCP